jgi:hypothetical protein
MLRSSQIPLVIPALRLPLRLTLASGLMLSGISSATGRNIPRVLILGDSVSMGYTKTVVRLLEGKADVRRPDANCGATFIGLRDLDTWLGVKKWDLIHFNFGLHDLRFCFNGDPYQMKNAAGEFPTAETGAPRTPIGQYEANLRELVGRLRARCDRLIWANTTPVRQYHNGYDPLLVHRYNEVAARVMSELGVPVNDLHTIIAADLDRLHGRDHVHPSHNGADELAKAVASTIERALRPAH